MKINKIMTDLLKLVDKKKITSCAYGIQDDYIYFTPDGHRLFKIYDKLFLIDLSKALSDKTPLNNPKRMFNVDKTEEAYKTNELKVIDGSKGTLVKIESENSHAWINTDYLKDFDSECTFRISNHREPVFIYELGEVVGLILPVVAKEDLNND